MKHLTFIISLFIFFSCNSDSKSDSNSDNDSKEKELELKERELALKEKDLKMNSKGRERREPSSDKNKFGNINLKQDGASNFDQKSPVSVVNHLFVAARTGNYSKLSGLCRPDGKGDGDTQRICDVAYGGQRLQQGFTYEFKNGRVSGQARYMGSRASVPIKFGPNGNKDEKMELVLINGKWYLSDF